MRQIRARVTELEMIKTRIFFFFFFLDHLNKPPRLALRTKAVFLHLSHTSHLLQYLTDACLSSDHTRDSDSVGLGWSFMSFCVILGSNVRVTCLGSLQGHSLARSTALFFLPLYHCVSKGNVFKIEL